MGDMWDTVIDAVNQNMPNFEEFTLKGYRQNEIRKIPQYLDMVFSEAAKRYGFLENGKPTVQYLGHRFLSPEECLKMDCENTKYSGYVDVLPTEAALCEFRFKHGETEFTTHLYIPYLVDDAIIVNGTKYHVMFALTDRVFYHIVKDNGIGIKILCGHLRFCRNMRYSFYSTCGHIYGDHIVTAKIHLRDYKPSADDLRTVLLLYPLVKFGLKGTLRKYGVHPDHVTMTVDHDEEDEDFEYFEIRPGTSTTKGLYLKVNKGILCTKLDTKDRIKMQVITALHYILQYFVRCQNTSYRDNVKLVDALMYDPEFMVYKVILGKTIFGLNYDSELQVAGHIKDHLQSLEIYMDPETKRKLAGIGVYCEDVYDLIHYISENIDKYVANYFPANIYNKQLNVLDLLLGGLVSSLFLKIYRQTNNRKGDRPFALNEIISSFRISNRTLMKIYSCSGLIYSNTAVYNDNGLVTALGRRKRATFTTPSAGGRKGGKKGSSDVNLLHDPAHRSHSSAFVVESGLRVQNTDPTMSGTINPYCKFTEDGNIIVDDWIMEIAKKFDSYMQSK